MEEQSVAQIIESSWEKVEAHITLEEVMASFLTENLDQCGATICLAAFQLVSRVLDKGGYVRRAHKSENTPLSSVLVNEEGPWVEQDKPVDRHWDYAGTWMSGIESISNSAHECKTDSQKYYPLRKELVFERFCEPLKIDGGNRTGRKKSVESILKRSQRANFVHNGKEIEDPEESWSPIATSDHTKKKSTLRQPDCTLKTGPSEYKSVGDGHLDRVIHRWETKTTDSFATAKSTTHNLEPYWMFDMKKKTDWDRTELKKYKYNIESLRVFPVQKPDLVMEIVYTCPKQYSQKKIVVMVEIDGEDKTSQISRSDTNFARHDHFSHHPAKLAMKAMQSTSVQAVLQPHTYNIRSNFYSYLKDAVDRSLFNTTNLEITSFQDILNRLSKSKTRDNGLDDFHQLTRTIHIVWHMYRAHIKVAFLIYMREVHGIDMRDGLNDKRVEANAKDRMQDHHFFVNFTGVSMPNEIKFADKAPLPVQAYLREKLMLQSLVKIKVFDTLEPGRGGEESTSTWAEAPVMSLHRSNMTDWSARVSSGQIPMFPKEDSTSVPVTYATVQRVDIKALCEMVKTAATNAFVEYDRSRTISLKTDGMRRRDFPDRCYLTRREQLDRNRWWNKQIGAPLDSDKFHNGEQCGQNSYRVPGIAVRRHADSIDEDLVELNFGYEKPSIQRNYHAKPDDMDTCKWDQVDVRMHFFSNAIGDKWKESANGMWYVEDYVHFFKMLQTLGKTSDIREFRGDKCKFTCQPQDIAGETPAASLDRAQKSTKYRLRLHNSKVSKPRMNTIMKDKNLIDIFWQSDKILKYIEITDLETFSAVMIEMLRLENDAINRKKKQDPLYFDIVRNIIEYIMKNNIIIPLIDDADAPKHAAKKTKKKRNAANIQAEAKEKLSFFTLKNPQDVQSANLKGHFLGYDHEFGYPANTLIYAINNYAIERNIDTDVPVGDFFVLLYQSYGLEVIESKGNSPKKFAMDDKTALALEPAVNGWNLIAAHAGWMFTKSESDHDCVMPAQSAQHDLAYHIFSVLSFFFDCRDDGACRYRWEDWLLDYFGASSDNDDPSEFHHFEFAPASPSRPDYEYFNQTWFQMCFFLEHNFRNAISALHYRLFDMGTKNVGYLTDKPNETGLQTAARKVYNREKSLLNNRSSFAGLGNVSAGLSFRKYDWRTNAHLTLRHRIMSQLDNELPDLDPALVTYVRKFRIPDSELFLRIIRCPNILALRELAKQHLSPEPQKHMREVLEYFDPAIQSEIEVMLKFVQTDESVYVHAPEAHPSKRLLLTESQLLKWMRKTVNCTAFASSLGMLSNVTPLQCKYDMFLKPASFHVLKNLFCTRELINFGCQRPLKFILLQLALVDKILRCEDVCDSAHENDSLYLALGQQHEYSHVSTPVGINIQLECEDESKQIPCVIGTSRRGWPQRDLNKVSRKVKKADPNAAVDMQVEAKKREHANKVVGLFHQNNLYVDEFDIPENQLLELQDVGDEMTDDELRLWMLLAYARPCSKPLGEINVSITQEKFFRKTAEKGDCEDVELHYQEELKQSRRFLSCCIHQIEGHMFFERYEKSSVLYEGHEFPSYVKSLIPDRIDRKLIYIPKECADMLRRKKRPAFFTHEVRGVVYKWRPVFSGLRTWCWKRLLVKAIFLHSFGKITTRTKTLLSLYQNVGDVKDSQIKDLLRATNTATVDKIGDLSYKERWLPKEYKAREGMALQKQHTVLISLHEYQARHWTPEPGNVAVETHACLTYTARQKQLNWLKYLKANRALLHTTTSCRFLRIDKRLEEPFLTETAQTSVHTPAVDEDFFVHRDYLYFEQEKQFLVVNVNNTHYVKFPPTLAIRAYNAEDTGEKMLRVCEVAEDSLQRSFFFTAFDTRRCSWFRDVHLDTEEDTELVQTYKRISLSEPSRGAREWSTVSDQFQDGMQWACVTGIDTEQALESLKPAYALRHLHEGLGLFTMPDFYVLNLDQASVQGLYIPVNASKDEQINTDLQKTLSHATWMPLKGDSRFLIVEGHSLRNAYADKQLQDIMSQISQTLKTSASESMVD
jgi:hypothetical protein